MTRSDLFLFDLQSQTVITLTQPPPTMVDWHPELYEDWLAWYRRNLGTGESFIRLYNLSSSEQITIPVTVTQHTWVSLDDQYVIWDDWRKGYAATGQTIIYGARQLSEQFYLPILGRP